MAELGYLLGLSGVGPQGSALAGQPVAPANTALPAITGTATDGQTLSTSNGTWTGSPPISFAYQWLRAGSAIAGATAASYGLVAADIGSAISCRVTASNVAGSAQAVSAATAAVTGVAPANTALPAITGTATEGQTLSTGDGTWTGSAPISFAYQWRRNGADIAGATGSTYLLVTADLDNAVACRVTASNVAGTSSALSVAVGPVAARTDPNVTAINAEGWSVQYASPPTFDPIGNPKYVVLQRQGFTTTGGTTTAVERFRITQRVRQAFPANASLDANRSALEDYVYSTDTITGFTNNSTEVSPKPIARWVYPDRFTCGNTLTMACVAAHRNARSSEQVACVVFTVTDGTTTLTQTVSSSSLVFDATDKNPIVAYKATFDVTSLAAGQLTYNAKLYPWIGAAASVLDSAANAAGSRTFCPQVVRKNVTAVTTPLYAYVDTAGNDSTGVASTTAATASATPCLTVAGAIAKLKAANGGNTDGAIVRLKAGTQAQGVVAATNSSISECIIEPDPNAGAGTAIFGLTANWNSQHTYLRFRNCKIVRTTTSQITGGFVTFENMALDCASSSITMCGGTTVFRLNGVTITNGAANVFAPTASAQVQLVRGVTHDVTCTFDPFSVLGSNFTTGVIAQNGQTEPGFVAFNRFFKCTGTTLSLALTANCAEYAILQNVFEFTAAFTTAPNPLFRPSGDSNTGNVTHLVVHNNTFAGYLTGGRGNILYDETAAAGRTHKLHSFVGNIHVEINTKGDVFLSNGARIGNWGYLYGAGCRNEFSQYIDASSGGLGSAFAQAYAGFGASIGTSTTVQNNPLFTAPAATTWSGTATNGAAGAGNGTYTLQTGSPCKGKIATPVLKFDLAGAARAAANDTIGAYFVA